MFKRAVNQLKVKVKLIMGTDIFPLPPLSAAEKYDHHNYLNEFNIHTNFMSSYIYIPVLNLIARIKMFSGLTAYLFLSITATAKSSYKA